MIYVKFGCSLTSETDARLYSNVRIYVRVCDILHHKCHKLFNLELSSTRKKQNRLKPKLILYFVEIWLTTLRVIGLLGRGVMRPHRTDV